MTQFNMVDSPQGPDPKRLMLAVVITSAVLMIYSYFFAPQPEVPQKIEEKVLVKQENTAAALNEAPIAAGLVHRESTKPDLQPQRIGFLVNETGSDKKLRVSYRAEITNFGGFIDKYALTDFSEEKVLFDQEKLGSFLLSLSSNSPTISLKDNSPYEILSKDAKSITLRHVTSEGLEIKRHYEFLNKATIREQITWKNLSASALKLDFVLSGRKVDEQAREPGFFNPGIQGQNISLKTADKYERLSYADLTDKLKTFQSVKYVAFDDQFFLAAIIPDYADSIDHVNVIVNKETEKKKIAKIDLLLKPSILSAHEEKTISHQFFIGPKQVDLLSHFSVPLDENIDFGWFGVLSRPMLWLLVQIYGFVKNYGLAIIIITVIIKLLTYPLTQKSFSSQAAMKKLQPKIKELQEKFGHDRTLLGQKQMELYRTHGINPLAGCLPLLIQFPIWFAFFQMLRNSVELFDQPFYGWLTDLTLPDQYFVLPIAMGATMLIQQAFTPPPTDQPHMKYVMWGMPIFFTFIMLNMPSGLSLYMLTNNLLTIIQQIIIKRTAEKNNA